MKSVNSLKVFIGGQWRESSDGARFDTVNPYTNLAWASIPRCTHSDVDLAVEAAHDAMLNSDWTDITASARGALLHKLGDIIAANAEQLAEVEVSDNGKLITEMLAQMRYLPQWFYYYGGMADKIQGAVIPVDKPDNFNFTLHEPLGVIAAILPWNSPLLLLAFKMAPALAAGNTMVVKPSEYTSSSTLKLAELVEEAGFPPGVFNVVTGTGNTVGARLVEHPKVAKIAFTGGDAGGRAVYQAAAKHIKPVTLELGGKSPNIVFEDANFDNAIKGVISGIFAATGQTCLAGSRLLLQRSIHDEFVDALVAFAKTARMGNPMSSDTQVGPITTPVQYEKILHYISVAKDDGAHLALGGAAVQSPQCGDSPWFIEPTIFTQVNNHMRIAQEEVFGPVLAIIPFDDEEEAIAIANDIDFGLAAGVWTESIKRALKVSSAIRAGTVWVNTYRAMSYMSPFGGYKKSGVGRENGIDAMYEYLQTKSVWISTADDVPNPFVMR
ncbi:MAG: carnitine dehydratase [Gammaproteobacteria bacterium]|nr:MAG: carnitine dehydratase [Gammaproteobacteria bacterium]